MDEIITFPQPKILSVHIGCQETRYGTITSILDVISQACLMHVCINTLCTQVCTHTCIYQQFYNLAVHSRDLNAYIGSTNFYGWALKRYTCCICATKPQHCRHSNFKPDSQGTLTTPWEKGRVKIKVMNVMHIHVTHFELGMRH